MPAMNNLKSVSIEDISGNFSIRIIHNEQIVTSTVVEVRNTPWYHTVQLDDSAIMGGNPAHVYFTIHNHGLPAEFMVRLFLVNATSGDVHSIEVADVGWWPAKTWGPVLHQPVLNSQIIPTGSFQTLTATIPEDSLMAGNYYVLESYAVKKLPHLIFPQDADWRTHGQGWRARDNPHYSTIVVLRP